VDLHNRVYIGSMSKERNTITATKEILHNTKITSSAGMEAQREAKKKEAAHPKGRAVSHMEMYCVILGYPQVCTNLEFFHVPTIPLEERPGIEVTSPITKLVKEGKVASRAPRERPDDLDAGDVIPSWQLRNVEWEAQLPSWRTWSDLESLSLRDQCMCNLSLDAISLFSVRPPELRWVRQPKLYFRWFFRDSANRKKQNFQKRLDYLGGVLHPEYQKCGWVDGTDCRVYVRTAAVPEIVKYLETGGVNGGCRAHDTFYAMGIEVPEHGSKRMVNGTDGQGRPALVYSKKAETPYADVYGLFSDIAMWQNVPPRQTRLL